jgi:radical SAM superfamily enzyme YgiQ (UPF0313 family)
VGAKRVIALVYVNSALPSAPLSLGDIAAYALADQDIASEVTVRIFHLPLNVSAQKAAEAVLECDPYLVGFSAYSWNFHTLKAIARTIRGARREVLTVFGGPNVSGAVRTHDCLRDYPYIDFIVDGEGEIAFRQLLRATLADPRDADAYRAVPNLTFRRDGEIVTNPVTERIANLDEIPSPFLSNLLNVHAGPVLWETNRGCPYRCAYCYWGNGKQKLYQYSMERIEEELRWFARERVAHFWIADANFGILRRDEEIAELFCRINNEYRRPFRFFGVNWAKNSSERIITIAETLRNNRVRTAVTLAYQTLTPEAEQLSKRKSLSLATGTQLLRVASTKSIPVYTDLIWGLPGESYPEFLAGLDRVIDTGIPAVAIYPLEIIPGTEYYEQKARFGFQVLAPEDHSQELVLAHPKMTEEDHRRGVLAIHAHHLLHTFKTCHAVRRYLDLRIGLKHSQACEAMVAYLDQPARDALSPEAETLRRKLAEAFSLAGDRHGANIDETLDMVSTAFWDHWRVAEELFTDFFRALLGAVNGGCSAEEWERIAELLRFNLLLAPKPAWVSRETYSFGFDVGRFYRGMMRHWVLGEEEQPRPELERRPSAYRIRNTWMSRPIANYSGWWRDVETQMCRFEEVSPSLAPAA